MNQNQNRRRSPYDYAPPPRRRPPNPKKRKSLAKYGFRIAMFLVFFALVGAVWASLFFLSLVSMKTPGDIVYALTMTEMKNEKPIEVTSKLPLPRKTGFFGGRHYFPVNKIMENMGFVLVGDKNELGFYRKQSEEELRFEIGSATAYVNGEKYRLPGPVFMEKDEIYVPLEFLENQFENLSFDRDGKDENKIALEVGEVGERCLKIRKAESLPPVEELPGFGSFPVEFKADLAAYEKYFEAPAAEREQYLVLINPWNPIDPQSYVPPDLTDLADTRQDGRAVQQLRFWPAMALEAFLLEAKANGFAGITVTSAYRSYEYQSQLFSNEVQSAGSEEAAAVSVARPGQSEHQSGLGVDMHNYSAANQDFGATADGIWLAENAHHFGFILRYPKDKTGITGIKYEPWHFRYVGRRAASKIYEENLCLEEYEP